MINAWSQEVLQSQKTTTTSPTNTTLTNKTTYSYSLTNLTSVMCSDCQVGMYWGDENDGDYLDFYNTQFKGFNLVQENLQSGASVRHTFDTTEGIGVFDAGLVNSQSQCQNAFRDGNNNRIACTTSAAWDLTNAASGRETQMNTYDKYGNLVDRTAKTYTATCPPSGVSASAAVSWYGNWDGHLVGELDPTNPATVCDVQLQAATTYTVNDATTTPSSSNVPAATSTASYDSYGRVTKTEETSNAGTPNDIVHDTQYIQNDAISMPNPGVPTGTYIIDTVAGTDTTAHDGSGRVGCTASAYDGHAWATGQQSGLTVGLKTTSTSYATCGTATGSAWGTGIPSTTTTSYNASGDPLGTTDADANASPVIAGHVGNGTNGACNGTSTCTTYDANYGFLNTTTGNAFYQSGAQGYTTTAAGGYGLWPTSTTNENGQSSTFTYDPLGRTLTTTRPGETGAWTTQQTYATPWCPTTGAALACEEEDMTQRVSGTATVTNRTFYDGMGRPVESRTPGANGQDVIRYALYDNLGNRVFVSDPYFVTAYTGAAGAAAYSTPDTGQKGTTTAYDALGRVTKTTDQNSASSTTSYTAQCGVVGAPDTSCYTATTVVDADTHQAISFTDALGRDRFEQRFTGTGPYTLYATASYTYDLLGNQLTITAPSGAVTTYTYDALSRKTQVQDPNLGTMTYQFDPESNPTQQADARGAAGTVYVGYDGLNCQVWRSTHSDGSSPFATYTYDSTANGNYGKSELTGETFASGNSQGVTGSFGYTYDLRGRKTAYTLTQGGTSYTMQTGFNDADQAVSTTYPDGDVVNTVYTANDWLSGATEVLGGTTTMLMTGTVYSGAAGANGQPTQYTVGNGLYTMNLGYDRDHRLNSVQATLSSNNSVLYSQNRSFDAAGNTVNQQTTVQGQTDNEAFCYDALNRLIWAGSTGTPSCGTSLTTGTLAAQYTQTYGYDTSWRLTQGPSGSGYTYGNSAHP